jgi:hypothetical protein
MTTIQTSMDPKDWIEDKTMERVRWELPRTSSPALKRQHFPFSCRVTKSSAVYRATEGMVFKYARTKMIPASFPIEAMFFNPHTGHREYRCFGPHEAELLPPQAEGLE